MDGLKIDSESLNYQNFVSLKISNIYDSNKNLLSSTSFWKKGNTYNTKYEYSKIDKNGNWQIKTSSNDGKLHYRVERDIEYW